MDKLVSVIIPAYNSEEFIIDTLESVQNQTYQNWECIIINDGSTDNTEKTVLSFIEKSPVHSKFIYHFQKNGGLSSARNKGMAISKGDFIQFLDSDDLLFKDKIQVMVPLYESDDSSNRIYFCDYMFSNDQNPFLEDKTQHKLFPNIDSIKSINFKRMYRKWDLGFIIPPHCFLYPKKVIENLNFDILLKSKEDWDFYLSILSKEDTTLTGIEGVYCSYRVRKNSMSHDYTNLTKYTFSVLHKWKKKNKLNYLDRVSYYLFQAYIYRFGKKNSQINLKSIFKQLRDLHPDNFTSLLIFAYVLFPVQLIKKINNVIHIRIQ